MEYLTEIVPCSSFNQLSLSLCGKHGKNVKITNEVFKSSVIEKYRLKYDRPNNHSYFAVNSFNEYFFKLHLFPELCALEDNELLVLVKELSKTVTITT